MKIGILTFHDGINHGAFLQAYCLQETVKKMGVEVKIINYKSFYHYINEYKIFLFMLRLSLKQRLVNLSKIIKFKRSHSLFQLTRFSHKISDCIKDENFDVVILGSDEIWNFKNPLVGCDLTYFGQGINSKRIISYAPSFGAVTSQDPISKDVIACLNKLNSISVRDENSLSILETLSVSAKKVLDPTFLYDIQLPNTNSTNLSNYILIYMTDNKNILENVAYIQDYANRTNKQLVAIGYQKKWCSHNFINLDAFEWINFFKNADAIITNTFHGTIYSILSGKQFCVLNPGDKINKINSLLKDLELQNRKVDNAINLENKLNELIDYESVFQKIEQFRQESLEFLRKSIYSEMLYYVKTYQANYQKNYHES